MCLFLHLPPEVFVYSHLCHFYTDKHLNWNEPHRGSCFSINLSATLPLRHLVERL